MYFRHVVIVDASGVKCCAKLRHIGGVVLWVRLTRSYINQEAVNCQHPRISEVQLTKPKASACSVGVAGVYSLRGWNQSLHPPRMFDRGGALGVILAGNKKSDMQKWVPSSMFCAVLLCLALARQQASLLPVTLGRRSVQVGNFLPS